MSSPIEQISPQSANANKTSSQELLTGSSEPLPKCLVTLAARKHYVRKDSVQLIDSLNTLIVRASSSVQRAEEVNREMQLHLSDMNGILVAAQEQMRLLTYVHYLLFCNSIRNIIDVYRLYHICRGGMESEQLNPKPDFPQYQQDIL